ncbi:MAG: right-handed parallel beta-helix repeat-containing protein, partial [Candidatus Bathyarchaeota archaeon]|nr:right-handed parallel beta-helix repeat-containing protein [Candidatus Bathyarchaeota archaeon]
MKNKLPASAIVLILASVFLVAIPITPISASPAVINVPGDYSTIQAAVDNASSGDTIIVATGTYAGAIVDKNVTISGASGGASIITSGVPYKVGSSLYTAFRLDANANGAEIRSFTINCNSSESFYFAVFSRNADNVTVDSLAVNDAVQGITNWGGSNWAISNNTLSDTEAAGGGGIAIWLGAYPPYYPICSGNLVQNNTITATATAPDYTCPGIGVGLDLRWGAYDGLTGSEDLSRNQILNNNITAPGALNGVGIEIGALGLEGNATKIATVLGTIHDNTIRGNTIEGADFGVYFYTVTNLEILENEIKNCNEGVHIKDGSSGSTINHNNIFGNAIGLNNTAEELVDATLNYWGDSSGPSGVGPGTGDAISENVTYSPWLGYTFGTTPMAYHVDSTGKIQDAIDDASPADTILVYDGTYRETLIINKSLTLKAASNPVIEAPDVRNTYTFPESTATWDPVIFAYGGTESGGAVSGYGTINVTIIGFEMDGRNNATAYPTRFVGILYRNVNPGVIANNSIHHMYDADGKGDGPQTFGIMVYGDSDVTIEYNEVRDFSRGGIGVQGDAGAQPDPVATVEWNTVLGNGLEAGSGWWAENGIQTAWGAGGSIIENNVSNCKVNNPYWVATGIMVYDAADGVNILDNSVADCDTGIAVISPSFDLVDGNVVTGCTWDGIRLGWPV